MRVQLHRALSKLGFCSRTQAITLIKEGKVQVNGRVTNGPLTWVDTDVDIIKVAGAGSKQVSMPREKNGGKRENRASEIPQQLRSPAKVYWMLHKPKGYITTRDDEKKRRTIYDLLPKSISWIFPVGRLDMDSEGLLLLTNDGPWGQRLLDPVSHIEKEYLVWIASGENLNRFDHERLEEGVVLEGIRTLPCVISRKEDEVECDSQDGRECWSIVISEGRNRQVRKMFELLGYNVKRLMRVRIGSVVLGDLKSGELRELTRKEVEGLS